MADTQSLFTRGAVALLRAAVDEAEAVGAWLGATSADIDVIAAQERVVGRIREALGLEAESDGTPIGGDRG